MENRIDPATNVSSHEQSCGLPGSEDELKLPIPEFLDQNVLDINNLSEDGNGNPKSLKQPQREEPENIRKWREEQKQALEEKDRNEQVKKEEWRSAAKKELEECYKHYEVLVAKRKAANRAPEKHILTGTDIKNDWEHIEELCDFNSKTSRTMKDVSRMGSIILQLKQSANQA